MGHCKIDQKKVLRSRLGNMTFLGELRKTRDILSGTTQTRRQWNEAYLLNYNGQGEPQNSIPAKISFKNEGELLRTACGSIILIIKIFSLNEGEKRSLKALSDIQELSHSTPEQTYIRCSTVLQVIAKGKPSRKDNDRKNSTRNGNYLGS